MDEVRKKYIEINKRIFNQRDGEVLQMQKEYGATYKKSLGVPIISLENIAKKYAPSHELAKLLWEFGGREQIIVAAMLEEPEKIVYEELEASLCKVEIVELFEQITKHLLRRLPNPKSLVSAWIESEEVSLQIFAVLLLGHFPDVFSEEVLRKLVQIEVKFGSYLEKCLQRVFLKLGVRDKDIFLMLKENEVMQKNYVNILAEITDFCK